jgi:ribosomal protein L14E/L6E/L27E
MGMQKDKRNRAADGPRPAAKMVQDSIVVIGQLAASKCGRDRGEPYLVLEIINEAFVYLVNGDKRRVENPKRKNIKHLRFYKAVAEHLAQQWEAGQQVANIEVRRVIAGLIEKCEAGSETHLTSQKRGVEK